MHLRRPAEWIVTVLALFGLFVCTVAPRAFEPLGSLLPTATVEQLRRQLKADPDAARSFANLLSRADEALTREPKPVVVLDLNGGEIVSEVNRTSRNARRDLDVIFDLGFAHAITRRSDYAAAARRYVLRWAETYEPVAHPIHMSILDSLVIGYGLTRDTFSAAERAKVDDFLRRVVDEEKAWVRSSEVDPKRRHRLETNWNAHRLKLVGLIGYAIGDEELVTSVLADYRRHLEGNINADGSTYDFHQRDALTYHVYDLAPLLTLAAYAAAHGTDLFDLRGTANQSLAEGIAFIVPFCSGEREHLEFVHTTSPNDIARGKSGVLPFGKPWNCAESGRRILPLATAFYPRYKELMQCLGIAGSWNGHVARAAIASLPEGARTSSATHPSFVCRRVRPPGR